MAEGYSYSSTNLITQDIQLETLADVAGIIVRHARVVARVLLATVLNVQQVALSYSPLCVQWCTVLHPANIGNRITNHRTLNCNGQSFKRLNNIGIFTMNG